MDRRWWSLLAVCLATFMLLLDITVVNVALPDIQEQLHTDLTGLQWVVDAYTLVISAFTLTMGTLADRFRAEASVRDRRRGVHVRLAPLWVGD